MYSIVVCPKHKTQYVEGNGCLSCWLEGLAEKSKGMSLSDRLRDADLYTYASDEAATVLDNVHHLLTDIRKAVAKMNQVGRDNEWDKIEKRINRIVALLEGKSK